MLRVLPPQQLASQIFLQQCCTFLVGFTVDFIVPVYKNVFVWPPTTISTPSTSLAIRLSISIPAWPTAMILLMFCCFSSSTAFLTDSTSGKNLIFGPWPGLDNLYCRGRMYVSVEFGFLLKIGKHKACSKPVLETLHEKSRLMSANPSLVFCDSTSWIPHSCSMVGGFSTDTLSVGNNEMDYMENSLPGCPKEGQVPSPSCLTVGKSSLLDKSLSSG